MTLRERILNLIATEGELNTLDIVDVFPQHDRKSVMSTIGNLRKDGEVYVCGKAQRKGLDTRISVWAIGSDEEGHETSAPGDIKFAELMAGKLYEDVPIKASPFWRY
jgi:hypothetical protein